MQSFSGPIEFKPKFTQMLRDPLVNLMVLTVWNPQSRIALVTLANFVKGSSMLQLGRVRGGQQTAGEMPLMEPRPTEQGVEIKRTEGRLPVDAIGEPGSGPSNGASNGESVDGLQRALEMELVNFLRSQNSKLAEEVAFLKGKLESKSTVGSGVESSGQFPWSDREESRTPRNRTREVAGSPEKVKDPVRYTPNGTRIPDGPLPKDDVMPPVPPFPLPDDGTGDDGILPCTSYVSGLYDTCESKPRAKNGDVAWTPSGGQSEPGVLSPSEVKQVWLEREVRSLKFALDRAVSPTFRRSDYWNHGFERRPPSNSLGPAGNPSDAHGRDDGHLLGGSGLLPPRDRAQQHGGSGDLFARDRVRHGGSGDLFARDRAQHGGSGVDALRAQHGGSGVDALHDRAFAGAPTVPGGIRAAYLHGEHHDRDRAFEHGDHREDARAFEHGAHREGARASAHGDPRGGDRAVRMHGDVFDRDRALQVDRTPMEHLLDCGPGRFCELPGHGPGGGGAGDGTKGESSERWPAESQAGPMNAKSELPDLAANFTPLQFGDWLHLIAPVMKDISGVAGWWWETTLREAKGYYEDWKVSTPLKRIQIAPRLPESLKEHKFQRTEQRGIQMLLKSIPEDEQQALVTDRALSTTAILYKLLIRFQPGGPGEKQQLLSQLTSVPATKTIHEPAAVIRTWRRHFGRAQEVQAVLPDGVFLLKALDGPIQHLASMDPQAAFRLAQGRMQLQLDEKPAHANLWAFSQCLLAEAETLCLLTTSSTSATSTPLKLKQMQGDPKTPPRSTPVEATSKHSPTIDRPCKYFISEAGCKAGRSCKWLHSWDNVSDKASRCWICGGKDHSKSECKLRSSKKTGETGIGSGGGRGGGGENAATTSPNGVGGKAGAAAAKTTTGPGIKELTPQTAQVSGDNAGAVIAPEVTSSTSTTSDGKGGGSGGSDGSKSDKTAVLLQEATQLLKTLRAAGQ